MGHNGLYVRRKLGPTYCPVGGTTLFSPLPTRLARASARAREALLLGLVHVVFLLCADAQDLLLARLLLEAADHQFVQDVVRLVEVEDDVQLAHLGKHNKTDGRTAASGQRHS